jgi:hypothetical protein
MKIIEEEGSSEKKIIGYEDRRVRRSEIPFLENAYVVRDVAGNDITDGKGVERL